MPDDKHIIDRNDDLNNEAEQAYYFSVWFGAVVIHLITFGRTSFKSIYIKKHHRRNLRIGYISQLLFVLVLLYFLYKLSWMTTKREECSIFNNSSIYWMTLTFDILRTISAFNMPIIEVRCHVWAYIYKLPNIIEKHNSIR